MPRLVVLLFSIALLAVGLQPINLAAADSKATYDGKCASCHGPDGKGKDAVAKLLKIDISKLNLVDDETSKKSDAQLAKAIHDGIENSKMKSYKDQFSDEEIAGLVKYIRSLKK